LRTEAERAWRVSATISRAEARTTTHNPRPRRRAAGQAGFTLLEITIAITLFAIVSTGIYGVFSTGMRAYEMGMRTSKMLQTGRFAMDSIARDLKNVYFINETGYNIQYNQRLEKIDQEMQRLDQGIGDYDLLAENVEQFNNTGFGIDLSFHASGGDDFADISFVRRQKAVGARPFQPMHYVRVRYAVSNGQLIRGEEDVLRPDLDYDGSGLPRPEPHPETLVRGVEEFKMRFGFYYDGEWREATEWESSAQNFKSDTVEISYDEDDLIDQQLKQRVRQWNQQQPDDNLPSYVRVTLAIGDETKTGRLRYFERTINIVSANESHVPMPDEWIFLDESKREHTILRNDIVTGPDSSRRSRRFGLSGQNERPRHGEDARGFILSN